MVCELSQHLSAEGWPAKTQSRLKDEANALEKQLNELSPAFLNPEMDWERAAREASEDEQIASQNSSAGAEKIAAEKSKLAIAAETTLKRRILAGSLLGLAVVVPVLGYLAGLQRFLGIGIGSSIGFAAFGIAMFMAAARSAKSAANEKEALIKLELEIKQIREEGGKKRRALNEAMRDSRFVLLDEFLAAARKSRQGRQRLSDLRARAAEVEPQRERLQAQSDEIYQQLKEGLSKVGLSCSPGNLKFQIDILRSNLRRFRELDANYIVCLQNADSLRSKDTELEKEYNLKCSLIQSLLHEAQVETSEQFCEECSKRQTLLELMEKEASRTREFSRLAGALTLAQWKERLQQLLEQKDPQGLDEQSADDPNQVQSEPYLPYLPTIAESEEQEKRIGSQLAGAREEYARAVERVKQAFQNFRPAYEIDEDLAAAERAFAELEKNRSALEIALATLEKLSRQQQEVLAPQLNSAVEQRFLRLCGNRCRGGQDRS